MKIGIYSDVHFSEKYSIVTLQGEKYTVRLEKIIAGLNWAEDLAIQQKCDVMMSTGDFFDKPDLSSMEITALKEVKWNSLPHYMIVGNHEGADHSLLMNSTNALAGIANFRIIDKPELFGNDMMVLPYITERDIKPLSEYWNQIRESNNECRVIFSHNSIKGIQYGRVLSKEGIDIEEIDKDCKLFLNGHIHNYSEFCNNGINLGNFCGQRFDEDSFKYPHYFWIVDTDNGTLEPFENPFALNFYKLDFTEIPLEKLYEIKNNAVLSIICRDTDAEQLEAMLQTVKDKVIVKRVVYSRDRERLGDDMSDNSAELSDKDYLSRLYDSVIEQFGESDVMVSELTHLIEGD